MSHQTTIINMLSAVAEHLGDELLARMAFVGGCTTGLLITDEFALTQLRATDDVDTIIEVLGFGDYCALQEQLRRQGFRESPEDDITCRWRLGASLKVDIMPTDAAILGFSNRWYQDALATANWHSLNDTIKIRVISPPYFLASKIEAFRDRGNHDFLGSRDMEDILSLIDGRESLLAEVQASAPDVRSAIATSLSDFLKEALFEAAVQSTALNNRAREDLLFERLMQLATSHKQKPPQPSNHTPEPGKP
jgi:predicted nucleotidyltransferase